MEFKPHIKSGLNLHIRDRNNHPFHLSAPWDRNIPHRSVHHPGHIQGETAHSCTFLHILDIIDVEHLSHRSDPQDINHRGFTGVSGSFCQEY